MAATDAKAIPIKNQAYRVTFPILDADGDLVTAAAGLDSEVSIDGGTFADATSEATEIATSSGMYFLDLTAAEMNGDTIAIIVKTTTTGAKTTPLVLYTAARSINDLAYPTVSGRALDVSAGGEAGLDWANIGSPTTVQNLSATNIDVDQVIASVSGSVGSVTGAVGSVAAGGITAASIATGAIDADALAADASTEIRSLASGTADSGTTTTMVDAARTEADTDYWKGSLIAFTSGTLLGQVRLITAFNAATDTLTFAPATTVAVGTHTYEILPAGRADVDLWGGTAVNALVSGRVDASVGAMAANVVTAAAIADGAIDAATFAAGAIDNTAFNVTETLTANPAAGGITAGSFAAGAIDANAVALSAADEILGSVSGTADSGTTTTVVDAERTEADTDYWKGALVTFTSGTLAGQTRLVTAFNAATDTLTFAPATTVAVATHTYRLIPAGRADLQLWLGSVVNALIAGRVDANAQVVGGGVITAASFAAGAIDAAAVATGAIDADAIADNAIDAGAIATGAITAAKFAAGAIDAAAIGTGAIDADAIAASAITAAKFAAGAIDAAAIAADAIGASEFSQAAADKVFGTSAATLSELAQAIPAATPRPDQALMLLYMALRNRVQVTSTEKRVTNDALTVISKKALTDDGTTYQEDEMVAGP